MKAFRLMALAACAAVTLDASAQEQEIRCFSHRGGRMEHDENTLSAFEASYEAGYRGFETDIRMTRDGALVVTHDSSLERTTDGTGTVEEKTEAEIRRLRTKQGNKMLFLDELLDFLKGKEGLYVEFEMKTKPVELYPEERLHALLRQALRCGDGHQTGRRRLRLHLGRLPRAALPAGQATRASTCCSSPRSLLRRDDRPLQSHGHHAHGRDDGRHEPQGVKKAHKEGLIVSLWPGQSVEDFMLGAYLGCDYMCTDVPIAVKSYLAEKAPWIKVKY